MNLNSQIYTEKCQNDRLGECTHKHTLCKHCIVFLFTFAHFFVVCGPNKFTIIEMLLKQHVFLNQYFICFAVDLLKKKKNLV